MQSAGECLAQLHLSAACTAYCHVEQASRRTSATEAYAHFTYASLKTPQPFNRVQLAAGLFRNPLTPPLQSERPSSAAAILRSCHSGNRPNFNLDPHRVLPKYILRVYAVLHLLTSISQHKLTTPYPEKKAPGTERNTPVPCNDRQETRIPSSRSDLRHTYSPQCLAVCTTQSVSAHH